MLNKFKLLCAFLFLLSFFINYYLHHDLITCLANSMTLALSAYLFKNYLFNNNVLFKYFLFFSFGIIPLFYYQPAISYISLLPLISLFFFYLQSQKRKGILIKINKKILSWGIISLWVLFLLLGNSYSGEIIKPAFSIQSSQLIFNTPEYNYNIQRHQQDALFAPYKLRQLLYSKLNYTYSSLSNFFNFLTLKNLLDVFLLANLYPLFIGIYMLIRNKLKFTSLCFSALSVILLTAGIDRSPDKFQSLYLIGPVFLYLLIIGSNYINIKLYLAAWILSIFLLITPKI